MTLGKPPRLWTSVVVCVLLGLVIALGDLLLDCRAPTSEACVWGKALWPVTVTLSVAAGAVAGVLLHIIRRALGR